MIIGKIYITKIRAKSYWWLEVKGRKFLIRLKEEKIIKLLGNTTNQPTKFRTKNWIEINDDLRTTLIVKLNL